MTLQQLRYLIAIAEYGSINAAAQNLYASQSNLSTAIKELEQELGISIFTRSNRGVTLTNDGTELLGYARQVIEQANMQGEAAGTPGGFHAALRVQRAGVRECGGAMRRRLLRFHHARNHHCRDHRRCAVIPQRGGRAVP